MSKNDIVFGTYAVRAPVDSENIWDKAATMKKFEGDLDVFIKMQESDTNRINETLLEMYAGDNAKVAYNTNALITLIMNKIGFDLKSYQPLHNRVVEVLAENPRFYQSKGAGNGARYMNDEDFAQFEKTGLNPAELAAKIKLDAKVAKAAAK